WGVNYIYGTWQVLLGLRAIEFPMNHPAVGKAADWVESGPQTSGRRGASGRRLASPPGAGRGAPRPRRTTRGARGLIAAGRANGEAVRRGIDFLVETQSADGTWEEGEFTGTGFPRVFYLKYHLYRLYFPLMALARYRDAARRASPANPGMLA